MPQVHWWHAGEHRGCAGGGGLLLLPPLLLLQLLLLLPLLLLLLPPLLLLFLLLPLLLLLQLLLLYCWPAHVAMFLGSRDTIEMHGLVLAEKCQNAHRHVCRSKLLTVVSCCRAAHGWFWGYGTSQ